MDVAALPFTIVVELWTTVTFGEYVILTHTTTTPTHNSNGAVATTIAEDGEALTELTTTAAWAATTTMTTIEVGRTPAPLIGDELDDFPPWFEAFL